MQTTFSERLKADNMRAKQQLADVQQRALHDKVRCQNVTCYSRGYGGDNVIMKSVGSEHQKESVVNNTDITVLNADVCIAQNKRVSKKRLTNA